MTVAGKTIPIRRYRLRFRLALRGPVTLSGSPVLRDPAGLTAEAREASAADGRLSSSIAVRCRDNAVPSVHVAQIPHSSSAAEQRCQKETCVAGDFAKKGIAVYLPFCDAIGI